MKTAPGDANLKRWVALWDRLGLQGDPESAYRDLAERYQEPHRHYHNLEHVAHCLREFDSLRGICQDADSVELAIWFHDAVYDTHAHDNEEQSASLLRRALPGRGLRPDIAARSEALINVTKHQHPPVGIDEQVIVDADLSILGQPWDRFERYEHAIRAEYNWVSEDAFRIGRTAVLYSFLNRDAIYSTSEFKARYEAQARLNLNRSMMLLSAAG